MNKKKQVLHERLLDAEHALLISVTEDGVNVDFIKDPLIMGGGLGFLFAQDPWLAKFFMAAITSAVTSSAKRGDMETANKIRKMIDNHVTYMREVITKVQN